uniref:Uncharacterized protein n=1 Tax=Acrobeloides nanus TaxID=290746 RepID=A0A914CV87_9BILA
MKAVIICTMEHGSVYILILLPKPGFGPMEQFSIIMLGDQEDLKQTHYIHMPFQSGMLIMKIIFSFGVITIQLI